MKPEVLHLREADDPRDLIHRVVERLAQGGFVALPTETVYGIAVNALVPSSVARLVELKGRDRSKPFALCIKGPDEAIDWVPGMSRLGRRLIRRCWPGPVTLVFNQSVGHGLVRQLPEGVRQSVCPAGSLGLRVPAHDAVLQCQRLLPRPLVFTSANRSGDPVAVTAQEVLQGLGEGIDMILDDGPCRYGQPSSVVQVHDDRWEMLREGVVSEAAMGRLSRVMIVFVCTGNTCRSPIAEGICRELLSQMLSCSPEELPRRGYEVMSAGVAAMSGSAASPEAVVAGRELGVDLNDHVAQLFTAEIAFQADHIFTMTQGHLRMVKSLAPEASERVELLRRDGGDIDDPVGMDIEMYRHIAREIEAHLRQIAADLVP